MAPSVNDMVETILQHEGGFVNHPADPGGATNWGVTRATLSSWLGREASVEDVRALERETAKEIYLALYFHGPRIDTLPPSVQPQLFDMSINHGPRNAIRMLQDVLNMAGFVCDRDGVLGPQTRRQTNKALAEMGGHFINAISERREQFYRGIVAHSPKREVFLNGWLNRARSFRTDV